MGAGQVGRSYVGELWAFEEQVDCALGHAERAVQADVRIVQTEALQVAPGRTVAGDEWHGEEVHQVEELVVFQFEVVRYEVFRVLELPRVDSIVPGSLAAPFDVRCDSRDGHLIADLLLVRVGALLRQRSRLVGARVEVGRCPFDADLLLAGGREDFGGSMDVGRSCCSSRSIARR